MAKKRKRYGSFAWTDPKTGYLYARVRVRHVDGKIKPIYRRAINLTHAEQLANEIKTEFDNRGQAFLDGRTMTFRELGEWYKEEYVVAPVYVSGKKVDGMRTWVSERQKIDRICKELGSELINDIDETTFRR